MSEEEALVPLVEVTVEEAEECARECVAVENLMFDTLLAPYNSLVVEDPDKVKERGEKLNELVQRTRVFERVTNVGEEAMDAFHAIAAHHFMRIGAWSSQLEIYEGNLRRIDDYGEKLLQDELFLNVAQTAVTHGDLYVSGGSMARAMSGAYENGFSYISDTDVITDCSLNNFPDLADDIAKKLSTNGDIKVVTIIGSPPLIRIIEVGSGQELIDIVPSEYFAKRAEKVALALGEELNTNSDIETMLVKWNPYPYSQIAVRIDEGLNTSVVNGGRPLVLSNSFAENPLSYTNWQTIRKLTEKGEGDEADKLLRRAMNHVARFPKDVEKGTPLPKTNLINDTKIPETYEVALAEFQTMDDKQFKQKIRKEASENLIVKINRGGGRLWDLPRVGIDSLFSQTLFESRGYVLVDRGNEIGDKFYGLPEDDKDVLRVSSAIAHLTVKVQKDPSIYEIGEKCETPTEFFSVIAGISQLDDETLEKVSQELSDSWPDIVNGFNKRVFEKWSKSIRDAIQESEVDFSFLPNWKNPEEDTLELEWLEDDRYLEKLGKVVNAIRDSEFWKEKKELLE